MRMIGTLCAKSAGLALGLFASVSGARASEITMHVPVAATWGGQMLPAGDYRFDFSATSPLATVSGYGKRVAVFITSMTAMPVGEHSFLRIEDAAGLPAVREFEAGAQGLSFRFVIPKPSAARNAVIAAAGEN